MRGAEKRQQIERANVWWGAMLPHMKKPPSFQQFVGQPGQPKRQTPQELQAMCDAVAAAWGAERVSSDGS